MLNIDNYTQFHLKSEKLMAFISYGASPQGDELSYFVTVTDHDYNKDFFQKSFTALEEALTFANDTYGNWPMIKIPTGEECGCSEY